MDEPDDVEAIRYEYDIVDLAILDIAKGGGKAFAASEEVLVDAEDLGTARGCHSFFALLFG